MPARHGWPWRILIVLLALVLLVAGSTEWLAAGSPADALVAALVFRADGEVWGLSTLLHSTARRLTDSDRSTRYWHVWILAVTALLLPAFALLRNARSYIYISVVRKASPPSAPDNPARRSDELHVLVAALEHTIPERNVKVSAGGLGKVLDQMLREHPPGELSLVHPKYGDVDYGPLDEFDTIYCVIDSRQVEVNIYTIESELNGIRRKWYLLENELFYKLAGSKQPYPSPMTTVRTLKFFALWNQAVAELLAVLQPDIYHCMDYHAALAPLYLPEKHQVPMILVLHNADYMGVIETDFISDRFWKTVKQMRRLTLLFNLSEQTIRDYLMFEGRFNMLKAGVQYILDTQGGRGICAVSANYAKELKRERPLFSAVPAILALDNATDPSEDADSMTIDELKMRRSFCKASLQKACDLNISDKYRILIFIGRWVKQKGVDQIALLAPQILRAHGDVQMVFVGPAGDSIGLYAQELLYPMVDEFPGRLFVKTTFFKMSADQRAGADFCFAPSISEPFGYVDVEFGLLGVPTIGCAVGGLSKMPGVYFRQQNSDSTEALLISFSCAIEFALKLPEEEYWDMAAEGIKATFPFGTWRENLQEAYTQALTRFQPNLGASGPSVWQVMFEQGERLVGSVVGGVVQSRDHTQMGEVSGVVADMRRMDIDDEREFLQQDVSEQRTHNILRRSILRANGDRKDAAILSFYIFQADQRQTETNQVALWLMKPFKPLASNGRCIHIHFVVALGFIFFPVGLSTMHDAIGDVEDATEKKTMQQIFYLGVAVGAFIWIGLSKGIPPNLLMSVSQSTNVVLIFLTYSGLPPWSLYPMHWFFGFQSASRLLFAIWNFGEDFQGGFETITKRIALWESLRICADGLLVFIASSGLPLLSNLIRVMVSLFVLKLMVAAPRAYSTFVLPRLGWLEGISNHVAYWLLLTSQGLFALAWTPQMSGLTWWSFGEWDPAETNLLILFADVLTCITTFGCFMIIHSLTVWGPWPMRDFVCLVPPGSLLGALVVYILGSNNRNSFTLAVCLFIVTVLDAARFIAIFSSMLTIVGSKWYALKGGFISFMVIGMCTAISPMITSWIASLVRGGDPFVAVDSAEMVRNPLIVLCAVVPFSLLSYFFQLITLPFFNEDIVTYKGHGVYLPDGSKCPLCATQHALQVQAYEEAQREHEQLLALDAMSEASSVLMSETEPVPDTGSESRPSVFLPTGAVGDDQIVRVGTPASLPSLREGRRNRPLPYSRAGSRDFDRLERHESFATSRTCSGELRTPVSPSNVSEHSGAGPRVAREASARAPRLVVVRKASARTIGEGSQAKPAVRRGAVRATSFRPSELRMQQPIRNTPKVDAL